MRWGLCVMLACFLSGCLYLGDRNHAPAGAIHLEPAGTTLRRCQDLVLRADADDPDGDPLSYRWFVQVVSSEAGQPGVWQLGKPTGSPSCPLDASAGQLVSTSVGPPSLGSASRLELSKLPVRGRYQVRVEVSDSLGATSGGLSTEFEVQNLSPQIEKLHLERDPEVNSYTLPDQNGSYPAHGHYLAWLEASDGDDDLGCDSGRGISWEPLGRPIEDFEYWEPLPCRPDRHPQGALRFRLRPELADLSGELGVKVAIDDRQGGTASAEARLTVAANRPPCISATEPYHSFPLKLSANEPNRFRATFVSDDVPATMEYSWSVREAGAASFTVLAVQTSASLASLTLPAWFGVPGLRFELRLAVHELGGPEPACPESEALCPCSELGEEKCYRWVTWQVELQ